MQPPFIYYSGAYWGRNYSGLAAWIRYGRWPDEIRQLARGPGWVHLRCPDRELLLVRNALTVGAPRPLDGAWDAFVPFSATNTVSQQMPYGQYMINYFQHVTRTRGPDGAPGRASRRDSANLRLPGCTVRDGKTILSDSGGFQLLTGKAEWIDPVDLGQWYAENCDEGITLDIPFPTEAIEREYFDRSVAVQIENSNMILDQVPASFDLFNVVHGTTFENGLRFRAAVERDWAARKVCIAGVYRGNILASLGRFIGHVLHEGSRPYQQYHILGVYNLSMLVPLIRFAALMRAQGATWTLSSDASTAVYSASNRTMHLQRAHWRNAERLMLGRAKLTHPNIPNPHRTIPCSCPVCATLKYVDILSHCDDAIIPHIFITHNQLEIDRWVKSMVLYAEQLSAEEYAQLVKKQMGDGFRSVGYALRFVEAVAATGWAAAMKEFAPWMSTGLLAEQWAGQYTEGFDLEGEVEDRSELPEHSADWWSTRVEEIIGRYEHYHSAGKSPEQLRRAAERKRSAPKVQMNSAVGKAGAARRPAPDRRRPAPVPGQSTHTKRRPNEQSTPST